jgi:peptidoglycan hydrolase CwlO-like protein
MKKLFLIFIVGSVLTACNNSTESKVGDTIDSLNDRKDTLTKNVDSSFDAKIDSLEKKKDELKEKFDSTIEKKKDSVKGKKS